MADPAGEADRGALRLDFDRRLMLRFRGSVITSDGGLLAYRERDDALALTTSGGERLAEARTGRNRRHLLVGLLNNVKILVGLGVPQAMICQLVVTPQTGKPLDEGTLKSIFRAKSRWAPPS